jgi:hypothetical protein
MRPASAARRWEERSASGSAAESRRVTRTAWRIWGCERKVSQAATRPEAVLGRLLDQQARSEERSSRRPSWRPSVNKQVRQAAARDTRD